MATDQLTATAAASGTWTPTNESLHADVHQPSGITCNPFAIAECVVDLAMGTRPVATATSIAVAADVDATDEEIAAAGLTATLFTGETDAGMKTLLELEPGYATTVQVNATWDVSWGQAELDAMRLRFTVNGGGSTWVLRNLVVTVTYTAAGAAAASNNNRARVRRGLSLGL